LSLRVPFNPCLTARKAPSYVQPIVMG